MTSPVQPSIVVFDLGKVLLEWDPRHLYRTVFSDDAEMEQFLNTVTHAEWNLEQDRGRTWAEGIKEATARAPHYAREIALYRERWTEMQPCAIAGTVTLLAALHHAHVPLYALTNFAGDTLRETVLRYDFFQYFNGIVISGDEAVIKPDAAIYHRLTTNYGLDLTHCVFIDDVPKNVDAGKAVGMTGLLFTSPEQLAVDLRGLGFAV